MIVENYFESKSRWSDLNSLGNGEQPIINTIGSEDLKIYAYGNSLLHSFGRVEHTDPAYVRVLFSTGFFSSQLYIWYFENPVVPFWTAAASKSLQLCPTLCDPVDGSPAGSLVPGILQARTLEWVAISFSSAWKWKVKVKSLSRVRLFVTPWTAAYQAPPSMGFSRQEYWSGVPSPSPLYGQIQITQASSSVKTGLDRT